MHLTGITETGAWSQFENFGGTPPSKRSGHGGDRYGSKMIVFGGLANSGSQNDLYELDLGDLVDEQATVSEPDIAFSPPTVSGVTAVFCAVLSNMQL